MAGQGKKTTLLETEIQTLEGMGQHLADHLLGLPHEKLAELVKRMLGSYRLAARVANAAWWTFKATTESEKAQAADQLRDSLADYAPNNFSRRRVEIETLIDEFIVLRDRMEGLSADECRELVEEMTQAFSSAFESTTESMIPRTPG